MQGTLRPLPKIPPDHLNLPSLAGIRSYRPLPTPPPLSAGGSNYTSSTESVNLQTSPTRTTRSADAPRPLKHAIPDLNSSRSSFSSVSLETPPRPRPRLRISLDSLTVRHPTFYNPDQTLSPAVDRKNASTINLSRFRRAPPTSKQRADRASAANSIISPLVFKAPTTITELGASEPEEDGPTPILPMPESARSSLEPSINARPPRSRPAPIPADRTEPRYPMNAIIVAADSVGDSDGNEPEDSNPRTTSSVSLINGRESRAWDGKSWRPFPKISRIAMKTHLFRQKVRPTKSGDVPVADAKRLSQMSSPLNQTWYKERGGWRWVERDVNDVLAELRKLR